MLHVIFNASGEFIFYDPIDINCKRYYPEEGLYGKWIPTYDDKWNPIWDNEFGRQRRN
jgi:hypothetical protein